jgi:hypothetical protein
VRAETANAATGRDLPRTGPADAGAAAAVTRLYQGHAVGLIRLAVVMLGDRPAAEDVVQGRGRQGGLAEQRPTVLRLPERLHRHR